MPADDFYNKKCTRSKWPAPISSTHSDIEVQDDTQEQDFDDDVEDPTSCLTSLMIILCLQPQTSIHNKYILDGH